jgi:DNA-binding XRE family transcriptional regulator
MGRIYRKTESTAEERAEIERIRKAPKPLETTGGKITSEGFNRLMQLLAALRTRREELGLSQTQLAERLGIEPSALCRLETFKVVNPTIWTLCQWAEALGCELNLDLQVSRPPRTTAAASR